MKRGKKTDWGLLAKCLSGEASEAEQAELENWLIRQPANQTLFKEMKTYWNNMDEMNRQFDVDHAWNKLHNRILVGEEITGMGNRPVLERSRPQAGLLWIRVAASLILIALLGLSGFWLVNRLQYSSVTTAANVRIKTVVLPDGSRVDMNANSRLVYSRKFNEKERVVRFTGEAFFEVKHDASKPFIIRTGETRITDVGTSFNVKSQDHGRNVEVFVSSGQVELSLADNAGQKVILNRGDLGTYNMHSISTRKCEHENAIAWKTGVMDFQDIPLSDAIHVLNGLYGVNIVCLEPDLNQTLTSGKYRYPQESLDTILRVICRINSLQVKKTGNTIYLTR